MTNETLIELINILEELTAQQEAIIAAITQSDLIRQDAFAAGVEACRMRNRPKFDAFRSLLNRAAD